jgi:hypothetical protein
MNIHPLAILLRRQTVSSATTDRAPGIVKDRATQTSLMESMSAMSIHSQLLGSSRPRVVGALLGAASKCRDQRMAKSRAKKPRIDMQAGCVKGSMPQRKKSGDPELVFSFRHPHRGESRRHARRQRNHPSYSTCGDFTHQTASSPQRTVPSLSTGEARMAERRN